MYYPEQVVDEIRSKNDIVDVVSSYVKLQRKGANYFGLCPFHNEKSPSFSVTPAKQMYYCFGCGAGGNVINFIQKYENYSYPEALAFLADRAGVDVPQMEYSAEAKARDAKRNILMDINKDAANYFYMQLRSPAGKQGMDYFLERGLTEETIKKFGLGFAHIAENDLVCYLQKKGYEDKMIQEAGLASFDERFGFHDKFWNRVMFPILNANHKVIAFGGRVMGDGKPKYLNSPETMIFDKGRNFYGLDKAKSSRKNQFIICEGYMDVITMHQAGFTQTIATLGTALTSAHAKLLAKLAEEVILSFDSDQAGISAALRAIAHLREENLTAKVLNLTPYKDPDEFIKALGSEELQKRIDEAENAFLFEVRIKRREFNLDDPTAKTKFHQEISKMLCRFTETLERENYLEAVARTYHIPADLLRKMVQSYAKIGVDEELHIEKPKPVFRQKNTQKDYEKRNQRLLLTYLTEIPGIYPVVKQYITGSDFTDELYAKVAEVLFSQLENGQANPAVIMDMFTEDEEESSQIAEIFHTSVAHLETQAQEEKAFADILYQVKKASMEFKRSNGSGSTDFAQIVEEKKTLDALKTLKVDFTGLLPV